MSSDKWTFWLSGIVVSILTTVLLMLGTNVIANDRESRSRDAALCEKLDQETKEIYVVVSDVRILLSEIRTDVAYLKKEAHGSTSQ
jgi:membrane protein implicated in regulation of membrane protease activity